MAKAYAESFYNGRTWRKTSKAFMKSKYYICNRCGKPASICHHVIHITPKNINDPMITLNWDNLECLCHDCHTKHHLCNPVCKDGLMFDNMGNLVKIREETTL
jgi:5-methylcytosine-specific restriction endonuclease McrA